jgi:DNA replication protein DnaC
VERPIDDALGYVDRTRNVRDDGRKTLQQYDFALASGAPRAQIQKLAALTFIERAENVVLRGPSKVGKSHIAVALAYRSIMAGIKTRYVTLI